MSECYYTAVCEPYTRPKDPCTFLPDALHCRMQPHLDEYGSFQTSLPKGMDPSMMQVIFTASVVLGHRAEFLWFNQLSGLSRT